MNGVINYSQLQKPEICYFIQETGDVVTQAMMNTPIAELEGWGASVRVLNALYRFGYRKVGHLEGATVKSIFGNVDRRCATASEIDRFRKALGLFLGGWPRILQEPELPPRIRRYG